MKTLTEVICENSTDFERMDAFMLGYDRGYESGILPAEYKRGWTEVREQFGFDGFAWQLTPPTSNLKLDATVAYGLTLQSGHTKLPDGTWITACPHMGLCGKVCVLDNGNGAYPAVQRARTAKTIHMATNPVDAIHLQAFEIGKAVRTHGSILYRPDVNSDTDQDRVLCGMLDTLKNVTSYGYSKRPEVLARRPMSGRYVIAYSLNEKTDVSKLQAFLNAGGNVAAVTDRRKGQRVDQWASALGLIADVVDADKTDTWMLDYQGVIGDLSAKGKARTHGGDFVRKVYAQSPVTIG